MNRTVRWQLTCLGLTGVGWFLSGYLLFRVVRLSKGAAAIGHDVCSAIMGASCDLTLLSPDSFQLGLPLAAWGLIYFAVLGFMIAIGLVSRTALSIAAAGVGASFVLVGVLLTTHDSICYLCLVIHLINLILLLSILRHSAVASDPADSADATASVRSRKLVLAGTTVGAVLQLSLWSLDTSAASFLFDPDVVLAKYNATEPHTIRVDDSKDATLGPSDAPLQVVVFSNFQCPGCQSVAEEMINLKEKFGDQLRITYKHFPLSTKCNREVRVDVQPHACDAAWAAEAARRQNAFWQYHDRLFGGELAASEHELRTAAESVNLDMEEWEQLRQSAEVKQNVQDDIALGISLGVNETPSVFLNGRRIRPFTASALEFLINHQIAKVR